MRAAAAIAGVFILVIGLAGCADESPATASEGGDTIEPVAPDEGSGSGSAAVDWRTTGDSAALLDPATLENAITVIGTGVVTVVPDEAVVYVSVSVTRDTVAEARDEAARVIGDVLDSVRANGIVDEDLQTATLSLQPVYDYDYDVGTRDSTRLVGYRVDNGVRITIRDLDAVAAVIDDAMQAGATGLDGVHFSVSDPGPAEAEARALAVSDARSRAEALAEAAGLTLGRVLAMGEAQASPAWPYASAREADVGSTSIEAGTTEISVSVQVAWAID